MADVITKLREQSLRDALANIDHNNTEMVAGLKLAVSRNVLRIETEAKKRVPVNTGRLRNAIQHYQSGLSGFVAAHTSYAIGVEEGTKGGTMPPYKSIEYWFLRKNRIPLKKKWDHYEKIQAIRQKIYDKGTEAQPFMYPALYSVIDDFFSDCKTVLKDAWAG